MRRFNLFLTVAATLLAFVFTSGVQAQDSLIVQKKNQFKKEVRAGNARMNGFPKGVRGFVDANGDGYNDNAPDHDGDGIPNGRDEDYTRAKMRAGNPTKGFVDANGDGINDNALDADGDGIPNGRDTDYVCPKDGSGRQNKNIKGNGFRGNGFGKGQCRGNGTAGKVLDIQK